MRRLLLLLPALLLAACGGGAAPAGAPLDPPVDADDSSNASSSEEGEPIRILVRPEATQSVDAVLVDLDEPDAKVVRRVRGTPFWIVELPPGTDVEAFLQELRADHRILVGERDRKLSAPEGGGATLPVGGEFFTVADIPVQPALTTIGAPVAHARATGAGVRVAVIDTGVDASHVALEGRIEPGGWDFVDGDDDPAEERNGEDDDQDGFVDEGFGHGTFVASLVLAVAPDATVLPFRVLDTDCNGLVSSLAEAIVDAADSGVHVINLSLGMEHHVHVVGEAVKYARQNGVVVVASAGNTGVEEVTFPATIGFALSVTTVGFGDVLADFASYGEDVDLSAPGVEVIAAYPIGPTVAVKGSGTSFSAALAAGAFALLCERFPSASRQALVDHLVNTTWDNAPQNPGYEGKIGSGRLDLDAATE